MNVSIGPYDIAIPEGVSVTPFSCADYYGIEIRMGGRRYEILDNLHMGPRLLVSDIDHPGSLKDVPFHLGSAWLLPQDFQTTLRVG